MKRFSFFKKEPKIQGEIGYFGLSEWWLSEFSEEERRYILETFQPLGSTGNSLIEGNISHASNTAIKLLSSLAGWFKKKEDNTIAYRILKKAEELINDKSDILDVHFLFQSKIQLYYRNRDNDPDALAEAINACKQQIELAPKARAVLMASLKRPIMAAEKRPEVARRIPHLDGLNLASFPHLQSTLFSSPEVCNCLLEY